MTRRLCPVCNSPSRSDSWFMDYIVPDGWTLPTTNTVCLCLNCGMIYYDNDRTQGDYDRYYQTRYGYDGNLDPEKHVPRWEEFLAATLAMEPDKDTLIVDWGGGTGYVAGRLRELGYCRTVSVEVGDELPDGIDLLLAQHVLEHIYELRSTLTRLIAHLAPAGRFLVEVPDASEYYKATDLPMIDFQQVHVNHFTPATLDKLFARMGYAPCYRHAGRLANWDAAMYRAGYVKAADPAAEAYFASKKRVTEAIHVRLAKLREVKGPVILWGCGPYAMHMLALCPEVFKNIVQFIDNDPAFRGAVINGIPVTEAPVSNDPILVLAQQQATGLLARIEREYPGRKMIVI